MYKAVPKTFYLACQGRFRSELKKRRKYREVVASNGFCFACDFRITERHVSTGEERSNYSKKVYGILNSMPSKTDLELARNCYELVPVGQSCRLFLDIDVVTTIDIELPDIDEIAELYINELTYQFEEMYNVILPRGSWVIAKNKDQTKKRSCHLVNYTVNWDNNESSQYNFMCHVKANIQNEFLQKLETLQQGIDISVYYSNSLFRLVYNTKLGSDRVIYPGDEELSKYFARTYTEHQEVYKCGTHRKQPTPRVKTINPKKEPKNYSREFFIRTPANWKCEVDTSDLKSLLYCVYPDQKYHIGYRLAQCMKSIGMTHEEYHEYFTSTDSCLESNCYPEPCTCGRRELNLDRWNFDQYRKSKALPVEVAINQIKEFAKQSGVFIETDEDIDPAIRFYLDEAYTLKIPDYVEKKTVCSRYITDAWEQRFGFETPIVLVNSFTGTGKSSLCYNTIKGLPKSAKVLYVCSSKALTYGVTGELKELGFTRYNTSRKSLFSRKRLCTTINSIWRVLRRDQTESVIPQYELVIFDEITSIIGDLFGPCTKHFSAVCETLKLILQTSKQVWCLDAVLLQTAIEFAKISKRKTTVVINTWKPVSELVLYTRNSQQWFDKLESTLKDGKSVCAPVNSLTLTEHIETNILKPNKIKYLLTNAENMSQNPKAYSPQYIYETIPQDCQLWGFSQCITVGVNYNPQYADFEGSQFEVIFGAMSCCISHPQRFFQSIARVRHMKHNAKRVVHLMVNPITVGTNKRPCGLEQIRYICERGHLSMTSLLQTVLYEKAYDPANVEDFRDLFVSQLNFLWTFMKYKLPSVKHWAKLNGFEVKHAIEDTERVFSLKKQHEDCGFFEVPLISKDEYKKCRIPLLLKKFRFCQIYQYELANMSESPHCDVWKRFLKNPGPLWRLSKLLIGDPQELWTSELLNDNIKLEWNSRQKGIAALTYMRRLEQQHLGEHAITYTQWTKQLVGEIAHQLSTSNEFRQFGISPQKRKTSLGLVNSLLLYMYGVKLTAIKTNPFPFLKANLAKCLWLEAYNKLPKTMQNNMPTNTKTWRSFVKSCKLNSPAYKINGKPLEYIQFVNRIKPVFICLK